VTGSTGDWLDRALTTTSRREAVKIIAAAALAFAWPRTRQALPEATTANNCQRGCEFYFGATKISSDFAHCQNLWANALSSAHSVYLVTASLPLFGSLLASANLRRTSREQLAILNACNDTAVLNAKAHLWDCQKPGCPGFDPRAKGPDGPCASCTQNCCACNKIPIGFICCFYDCDDPDHSCC
jgi:hypothetical protein